MLFISNPRQHQTMPLPTSRTMTPTTSSMYQYINTQQQYHSSQATTLPLGEHDTNVRSYRPPANSVFVKVPQVQQQLSVTDPGVGGGVILCADCDTKFADNKSLVKHTRNQHQVKEIVIIFGLT